jgi:hypothetical protein
LVISALALFGGMEGDISNGVYLRKCRCIPYKVGEGLRMLLDIVVL